MIYTKYNWKAVIFRTIIETNFNHQYRNQEELFERQKHEKLQDSRSKADALRGDKKSPFKAVFIEI